MGELFSTSNIVVIAAAAFDRLLALVGWAERSEAQRQRLMLGEPNAGGYVGLRRAQHQPT